MSFENVVQGWYILKHGVGNEEINNTRVVGALRAPPRSLRLPGENTYFLQAQKFKKFKSSDWP